MFLPARMRACVYVSLYGAQLLARVQRNTNHEEADPDVELLKHIIRFAPHTAQIYVQPIAQVVLQWFDQPAASHTPATLATIAELAQIDSDHLSELAQRVLPTLIELLSDYSQPKRRSAAISALGKVALGTGNVSQSFIDHPNLSKLLVKMLRTEVDGKMRRKLLRLRGVLVVPQRQSQSKNNENTQVNTNNAVLDQQAMHAEKGSDSYFEAAAMNALMRIANDSSLFMHHSTVFQVIIVIFEHLKTTVYTFLDRVVPSFLYMIQLAKETSPGDRWLHMVMELARLVDIVKKRITPVASLIINFLVDTWVPSIPMVFLVRSLAEVLRDDFIVYLPQILPTLHRALLVEPNAGIQHEILPLCVLLSKILDGWLHMVLPPIISLISNTKLDLQLRTEAVYTVTQISANLSLKDYGSLIVHTVATTIDHTPEMHDACLALLMCLVRQMGTTYIEIGLHDVIAKQMAKHKIQHLGYSTVILYCASGNPLPQLGADDSDDDSVDWENIDEEAMVTSLQVDQTTLKEAWEVLPKASLEDWSEWIRQFGRSLLKESTSPALRACSLLADIHEPLVRELFNAAFVSCWAELHLDTQDELMLFFESALADGTRNTRDVKRVVLNLAEFMDSMHKGRLPISTDTLIASATANRAYAKALHYKEAEFFSKVPSGQGFANNDTIITPIRNRADSMDSQKQSKDLVNIIADLVEINNALQQHKAAAGALGLIQKMPEVAKSLDSIAPTLNEKLGRWDKALQQYQRLDHRSRAADFDVTMGQMRCLRKLGMLDELFEVAKSKKNQFEIENWRSIAKMACNVAASAAKWNELKQYADDVPEEEGALVYKAMISIHEGHYWLARAYIAGARRVSDARLISLLGGGNDRLQSEAQTLTELEECIEYRLAGAHRSTRQNIQAAWRQRLQGCQKDMEVWSRILQLRSLAMMPHEDYQTHIEYSSICFRAGEENRSRQVLTTLLQMNPAPLQALPSCDPVLKYAFCKHLWLTSHRDEAYRRLQALTAKMPTPAFVDHTDTCPLKAKCCRKLGAWKLALQVTEEPLGPDVVRDVAECFMTATSAAPLWQKAWHSLALFHFRVAMAYTHVKDEAPTTAHVEHALHAVNGFFKSISLSSANTLQDTLHLLRLWFTYGAHGRVIDAVNQTRASIRVDVWRQVIPQLIARIDVADQTIRQSIHQALLDIGRQHPQAIVFPLSVSARSTGERAQAARRLMAQMEQHSWELVHEANLVADELIRVGVLWHEQWYGALQSASNLFYEKQDVDGMIKLLKPLHDKLHTPGSLREIAFVQAFGSELKKAEELMARCKSSGDMQDAFAAWNYYYRTYKRIVKMLPLLKSICMKSAAPKLLLCKNLHLAVPGTYRTVGELVTIASFDPDLRVIISKQRPRTLSLWGSDGRKYDYLLKGQEDPRMDERVMSVFSLVNRMLEEDKITKDQHLKIRQYSITPLSPNSGLIGWVAGCDTLHELIRDYRKRNNMVIHAEHKWVREHAPTARDSSGTPTDDGYDKLLLEQKVELFQHAITTTSGDDLASMQWLNSPDTEKWLVRRNNYTRTLAVMSMVGYILGLGDRHPSNIMIDQRSGDVCHIDFDDCFEVAQQREKYPENVPFRLTRMLIAAMEVGGIEGTFRSTCENTMRVMRSDPDSLIATLQIFIHDPILRETNAEDHSGSTFVDTDSPAKPMSLHHSMDIAPARQRFASMSIVSVSDRHLLSAKARKSIACVEEKLSGLAFSNPFGSSDKGQGCVDVTKQVQQLIDASTSPMNLSQLFMGWCPYW